MKYNNTSNNNKKAVKLISIQYHMIRIVRRLILMRIFNFNNNNKIIPNYRSNNKGMNKLILSNNNNDNIIRL